MNDQVNQQTLDKDALIKRVSFLQEMISQKITQFNEKVEALKGLEGHSAGSKEIVEKISAYIKKQQVELDGLVTGQKISVEISKFIGGVLENTRTFVRLTCGDVERLYFSKQGELLFLQQEVEKLASLKSTYEQNIKTLNDNEMKQKESAVVVEPKGSLPVEPTPAVTATKKKRVRPDQDPSTRAGRAALDIAERRRKYQKKSP